jgi:hypothetical protein
LPVTAAIEKESTFDAWGGSAYRKRTIIRIGLKPREIPGGIFSGQLQLKLDRGRETAIAQVHASRNRLVKFDPAQVFLGTVRPGESVSKSIICASQAEGCSFRILSAESDDPQLAVNSLRGALSDRHEFKLTLTIPADFSAKHLSGKVLFETSLAESFPEALSWAAFVK